MTMLSWYAHEEVRRGTVAAVIWFELRWTRRSWCAAAQHAKMIYAAARLRPLRAWLGAPWSKHAALRCFNGPCKHRHTSVVAGAF
jgi:hypothetical protein